MTHHTPLTDEQKQALLDSPEARALLERINNPVDLHPDLAAKLEEHESLGTILRHPLVYAVPYIPTLNGVYNDSYTVKNREIAKALETGEIGNIIFLFERAYRLPALLEMRDKVKDHAEFWRIFGYVYTDSENIGECMDEFITLLHTQRPGREYMMKDEERKVWAGLPEKITVYRGHKWVNEYGFSWSLSYTKALWFARRHEDTDGGIISGTVDKKDVYAFFHRREEMDVLVDPSRVQDAWSCSVQPADALRSPFQREWDKAGEPKWKYPKGELYHRVLQLTAKQFALNPFHTNHGPDHWMKVEHNGHEIANRNPDVDRDVVWAFALIHDCKRENEHRDPDHGHRAAEFWKGCAELQDLLRFTDDQKHKLEFALRYHNDGQVSADPTIGACWDADRLDLVRVCYVPKPSLFSTEAGRSLIFNV